MQRWNTVSRIILAMSAAMIVSAGASQHQPAPRPGHSAISSSWLARVRADLARQEYEISTSRDGLQAPNRAQGLRTYFDGTRVEVVPRTTRRAQAPWCFAWQTAAWGRASAPTPLGAPRLHASGARAEYVYADGFVEWYENRPDGIEQGFLVQQRPPGQGPLAIAGRYPSGLHAHLAPDGQRVEFRGPQGVPVLDYGGLRAEDAAGQRLPAHLESGKGTIRIVVDDTGARYPITIDPLMTSPAWHAEGNQVNAHLGLSVCTAGDVNADGFSDVVIGAPNFDGGETEEGRVYVYHGSDTGLSIPALWLEQNQPDAHFGDCVSPAGDVNGDGYDDLIIGTPDFDGSLVNEGGAFLYLGSPSGVGATPSWTALGEQAGALFGCSAATAGDVNGDGYADVVIGASAYDNGQTDEGQAYVYHGSPTGLPSSPDWTAEGDGDAYSLGVAVATAGDVNGDGFSDVVVGVGRYANGEIEEGAAYVYHGASSGLGATPDWIAEGDCDNAHFGTAVATAGDVNADGYSDVIVGALHYTNDLDREGRAYVYHGSSTGLAPSDDWMVEGDQALAYYGCSVATAGDVDGDGYGDVIVGAYGYDDGEPGEGAAFVYRGSMVGLRQTPLWSAEGDQNQAQYGYSVATAGDVNGDGYSDVLVGAPYYDGSFDWDEGWAYAYYGSANGLTETPAWTTLGGQSDAHFGLSVSYAGDVDGDGFGDVIVGAPLYDGGLTNEGRACVYRGIPLGIETSPSWTAEGDQDYAHFGAAVSAAGDVNGDGYGDVIVGAPWYDHGETDEGGAFVYCGSETGLDPSPAWTAEGDQVDARFGYAVSTAGDVNGDGCGDVIVGDPRFDSGETDEGKVFVFYGSTGGLSSSADWTAESDQADARFGCSVSTAGDVNGDSYSDVIIGARLYDGGNADEGRAYVYRGSGSGLEPSWAWTTESDLDGAHFGHSVATAGDVNGDGYSDVIVGAPDYTLSQPGQGLAFGYYGSSSGLETSIGWAAGGGQSGAEFGYSLSAAGDVNGDGYSDIIVGEPGFDTSTADEGRARVFHGSTSGLDWAEALILEGDQEGAEFGTSVSTAGDVNGDGYGDVIVGAPFAEDTATDEGAAYIYLGNNNFAPRAREVLEPRQRRVMGGPLALLGKSDVPNGVLLLARGRTPAGRARVRLEWNLEELGTPLPGATIAQGDWHDTGAAGASGSHVDLEELVADLVAGTPYHWRARVASNSPYFPHTHWMTVAPSVPSLLHFRTSAIASATDPAEAATVPSLLRVAPRSANPFGRSATVEFALPRAGHVHLAVYNPEGRCVAVLSDGHCEAGRHSAIWDRNDAHGRKTDAGVYYVRLTLGGQQASCKLIMID